MAHGVTSSANEKKKTVEFKIIGSYMGILNKKGLLHFILKEMELIILPQNFFLFCLIYLSKSIYLWKV